MKRLFLVLLAFLLMTTSALADSVYGPVKATPSPFQKGDFVPSFPLEDEDISLSDYNRDGITRALLVHLVGMSLNTDDNFENDIDLTSVMNVYTVAFDDDMVNIIFDTKDLYMSVNYLSGGTYSYYIACKPDVASDAVKLILAGTDAPSYRIDMDDYAYIVDFYERQLFDQPQSQYQQ